MSRTATEMGYEELGPPGSGGCRQVGVLVGVGPGEHRERGRWSERRRTRSPGEEERCAEGEMEEGKSRGKAGLGGGGQRNSQWGGEVRGAR